MTGILKIVKISKLKLINQKPFIYINNINNLLVCLGFCLFVSNKRQKGLTYQAQFFCGTSQDPGEDI